MTDLKMHRRLTAQINKKNVCCVTPEGVDTSLGSSEWLAGRVNLSATNCQHR